MTVEVPGLKEIEVFVRSPGGTPAFRLVYVLFRAYGGSQPTTCTPPFVRRFGEAKDTL